MTMAKKKKRKGKKRDWTKGMFEVTKGNKKVVSFYNPRHGDKPYKNRVAEEKPYRPKHWGKD